MAKKVVRKLAKKQVGGSSIQGPVSKESTRSIEASQRSAPKVTINTSSKAGRIADYDRAPANARNIGQDNTEYDKAIKAIQISKKSGGSTKTKKK